MFYANFLNIILTGTPAGRNLSNERMGITKQSCSSVDNEIGSLRELTKAPAAVALLCCPLKFTVIKMNNYFVFFSKDTKKDINNNKEKSF